ncbi:hypothetical protein SAMN04487905_111173 [Actinopolyspora xinjiangensis]|uniref:Uncharacterized protein n=1 Tax=Actinopolyspora xinjiangensis TaxID=405564 RepID=A0A1H0WBZ2_9ACTN|nr:hypothetical protein SAMN04487905_111173 [Actinopolyspora xinjiangensis]
MGDGDGGGANGAGGDAPDGATPPPTTDETSPAVVVEHSGGSALRATPDGNARLVLERRSTRRERDFPESPSESSPE